MIIVPKVGINVRKSDISSSLDQGLSYNTTNYGRVTLTVQHRSTQFYTIQYAASAVNKKQICIPVWTVCWPPDLKISLAWKSKRCWWLVTKPFKMTKRQNLIFFSLSTIVIYKSWRGFWKLCENLSKKIPRVQVKLWKFHNETLADEIQKFSKSSLVIYFT